MRNNFGGTCYRCGQWCAPREGHFERFRGTWRVQHAACAVEHRGVPDTARVDVWRADAQGTGRRAQRARRKMREAGNQD